MNTQKLLDLIRINEEVRNFDLNRWTVCNTYGCLVGNYYIKNKNNKDLLKIANGEKSIISQEFNLSHKEAGWLFNIFDPIRLYPHITLCGWGIGGEMRDRYDRKAAINRVRKFVYYKLHKREMLYDENGCVRESARKAEGNQMVIQKVLETIS